MRQNKDNAHVYAPLQYHEQHLESEHTANLQEALSLKFALLDLMSDSGPIPC
jgi:hypothetical protein